MSEKTYPHKLTLKYPVKYGSEEVKEVNYRDPVGRDMHDISIGGTGEIRIGNIINLFAKVSDQPPPFFDLIKPQDYMKIVQIGSDFLGSGQ